ncbi:MAG: hypothetical protein M5U28_38545 [Sandaracinaceae bacterium]|nr:hypothetical protein [Sandaracinaceae bacterium]
MARLREQASREEPLPDSIAELLVGDRIARESARETLALWTATRARLRERGDFVSAERLFHLTRLLLPHTTHQARRALLETALESLPDHRHRHVLRCELAIGAARLGELEAAAQWLEAVEPRPIDLLMDSAARAARATLAIATDRHGEALSELAERAGDVPASPWYREAHALLRAHALEAFGRVGEAADALRACDDDIGSDRLDQAADEHEPLRLAARARLALRREKARDRVIRVRAEHQAACSAEGAAWWAVKLGAVTLAIIVGALSLGFVVGWWSVHDFIRDPGEPEGGAICPVCTCFVMMPSLLGMSKVFSVRRLRRRVRELEVELRRALEAEIRLMRGRAE